MIDTVKIVSMIPFSTFQAIQSCSDVKTSYRNATGEIHYKIIKGSLEGSYSSSLSIRVGEGGKYRFVNMYYIEIEGSYHKLVKGYNSHNGFYNLVQICSELIRIVSNAYHIELPSIRHWFLQRVDIAICFDLKEQQLVTSYINNINCCNYPRRKLKHYEGETIYLTGSTTTLKIYNKQKEFIKHDKKNFLGTDFELEKYLCDIKGFVRFECEIKKRELKKFYNSDYVRIVKVNYSDLRKIWENGFRKFFKLVENDLVIVKKKEDVKNRLSSLYSPRRAKTLFNFYLILLLEGTQTVKQNTDKSTYYKNISDLKKANVDFSQKLELNMKDTSIVFNPFESEEVY